MAGQWSHLERLGGGIGTRGPGETQIETDRRLVRGRIGRLKQQIADIRRHRALYRRNRARQRLPVLALVGYTNAGKSTLMNRLTRAGVLSEDRLFATLDPVTRRILLEEGRPTLLTDTVGFIQKLPTELVAAFRATLEELEDADLLLHVIDITHPNAELQRRTVEETLDGLGLLEKPRLDLLNKVDRLETEGGRPVAGLDELAEMREVIEGEHVNALLISAERGWGLDALRERAVEMLDAAGAGRRLARFSADQDSSGSEASPA